jgi:hypothetical protein
MMSGGPVGRGLPSSDESTAAGGTHHVLHFVSHGTARWLGSGVGVRGGRRGGRGKPVTRRGRLPRGARVAGPLTAHAALHDEAGVALQAA